MKRPAVFFDKDGTLLVDVPYNVDPRHMRLAPGAGRAVHSLAAAGYAIVVVSNQSGVARGLFPLEALAKVSDRLEALLAGDLTGIYYCPHHPQGSVNQFALPCTCRKPASGMLTRAAAELDLDLRRSWMVGDILDDIEAGRRARCRTILLVPGGETEWRKGRYRESHHRVPNLMAAARTILRAEEKVG